MLRIQFLGTGDAFHSGGRNHTAFHIKSSGLSILMDCGVTTLNAMHCHGTATDEIDVLLITHFHGDHYGGVPYLLLDAAVHKRTRPLIIVSPAGGKDKIKMLLELLYYGTEVFAKAPFHFIEYHSEEPVQLKDLYITAYKVEHSENMECYGLRLQIANQIISYTGDTRWCDALIPLSRNADLFICECCFYNMEVEAHMNYKIFSKNKHLLKAKRIILTHFDQEMIGHLEEVQEECASDGLVLNLP